MTVRKLHPKDRVRALKLALDRGLIDLLFIDTETSLMEVYTFYIGRKVFIDPKQVKSTSKLITIQYQFERDSKVSYLTWDKDHDDKSMLKKFSKVVESNRDLILIGQNHKEFDLRVLNKRIKDHELEPIDLNNLIKIDTLTSSRSSFREISHRLDHRSKEYGFGGKHDMELQDWIDIGKGDDKKLKKMIKYGCKDVSDLRSIFWRELPYYMQIPPALDKILRQVTAKCRLCEANKQAKYNVKEKYDGSYECLTCGDRWEQN